MAFNPIDSSTIEAGDAVTQELFATIKDDFDDHESRLSTVETNQAVAVLTGEVRMYSSAVAPTGWLNCNGAAVSRTTYSSLFAVTGVQFGSGDGLTTFNLPDFRSRSPVGMNPSGGGGLLARIIGALFGAETANLEHNHQWYDHNVSLPDNSYTNTGALAAITVVLDTFVQEKIQTSAGGVTGPSVDMYTENKLSAAQSLLSPSSTINFIIKT